MSNTERIIALIVDLLADRGWLVVPSEVEGEWSVSAGDSSHEVLLVLQRTPVQTYLGDLIASYLPHEMVDAVGTGAVEDELATDAVERLDVLLSAQGPGLLTEVGIQGKGSGAEIYSVRALRAAGGESEPAANGPWVRIAGNRTPKTH